MSHAPGSDPAELLAHAEDLRRLASAVARDAHDAEDLAQDAWVELLEGRARSGTARDVRTWLGGMLRNLKRERARGAGRRGQRERRAARPEAVAGGEGIVERLETFRMLAAEVAALEEPYRSSVWQRFFEGRTAEEIAALEGVSPATVRSRWMRALAMLRERLDRRHGGDRGAWLSSLLALELVERSARRTLARGWILGAGLLVLIVPAAVWIASRPGGAPLPGDAPPALAADAAREVGAGSAPPLDEVARALDRTAAAAPAVRGDATPAARVRLRILDAITGEPVPWYAVVLRSGNGEERAQSDGSGTIVSTVEHALGDVAIELIDDERSPPRMLDGEARRFRRALPWTHAGTDEHALRVTVGPTFRLDLSLPAVAVPDLGGAGARTSLLSPLSLEARLIAPLAGGERGESRAAVRVEGGAGPWVRFHADALALPGGGPWVLRLATHDGLHAGEARVPATRGPLQGPIAVAITARARLALRVEDARGAPVDAWVDVERAGATVAASREPVPRLSVDGLEPGTYRVRARALGRAPWERDVELEAGGTRYAIVVEALAGEGPVAGVVRADADLWADFVLVLRDAGGGERRVRVQPGRRGALARPFRFESVPAGEYELSIRCDQVWRWRPPVLRVSPPAEGLEFAAELDVDAPPLILKATDRATGAVLEQFDVRLHVLGGASRVRSSSIGAVTFPGVPRDARLEWSLVAPGWRPARGTEVDLRRASDRQGVEVALERGFGMLVRVLDAETRLPVEGVLVLADGAAVARTDARGELELSLPDAPQRIEARRDGGPTAGGAWHAPDLDRLEILLPR